MRRRISIRGRVRPSVRPSVGPSVRLSRVIFKRVLGASCAVYPALFLFCLSFFFCFVNSFDYLFFFHFFTRNKSRIIDMWNKMVFAVFFLKISSYVDDFFFAPTHFEGYNSFKKIRNTPSIWSFTMLKRKWKPWNLPIHKKTSLTEFRHQMRSGDLPAYLSLNCLFNGVVSCSWWYFVQIQFISQKFNSLGTDGRTDGRADGRTDRHTLL